MPVEHDDRQFEGRLSHALHDLGGGFDADRAALAAAGRARGRRLRLRRRASVIGGMAGIALVGVGAAVWVPWSDSAGPPAGRGASVAADPSAGSTDESTPTTVSQMITALEGLLPDGKISERDGRGFGKDGLTPYARVVFDDGKGRAAVELGVGTVEPGDQARQVVDCPDKALTPYDGCVTSRMPDGSLLKLFKGYEYPDRRVDTKRWTADLVTPTGQHVFVSEWNAPAEKGAATTRPEPPLSSAQLRELVSAQVWRRVVDAIPADPSDPTPSATPRPGAELSVESVLATLVPLLPKGAEVVEKGDDYTYVVLDDGKGRSYVQIDVQPGMGDVADSLFGKHPETLPDGTKVVFRESGGDKGVAGSVQWTFDTLRTDGFRVVVSAFNAGTQHEAPTRATPALTEKQLREIALSPQWDRFR